METLPDCIKRTRANIAENHTESGKRNSGKFFIPPAPSGEALSTGTSGPAAFTDMTVRKIYQFRHLWKKMEQCILHCGRTETERGKARWA